MSNEKPIGLMYGEEPSNNLTVVIPNARLRKAIIFTNMHKNTRKMMSNLLFFSLKDTGELCGQPDYTIAHGKQIYICIIPDSNH